MSSMYMLIILSIIVAVSAYLIFLYYSKKDQFDDIEAPKYRMLDDEDDER